MPSILQTIKTATIQRPSRLPPVQHRRNKLINALHLQVDAATARGEGRQHTIKKLRRIRSKQTGELVEIVRDRAVKVWWWTGQDGRTYMEVKYGWKALEIAKGKTTIEVGDVANVIPVLKKLTQAAELGEFDEQLDAAFSRLGEQLRARKRAVRS